MLSACNNLDRYSAPSHHSAPPELFPESSEATDSRLLGVTSLHIGLTNT